MYGFVNGVSGFAGARVGSAARCSQFSGVVVRKPVAVSSSRRSVISMAGKMIVPSTDVLGIGKDVPGSAFLMISVISLFLGGYCVYESNIANVLTAGNIKPLYVIGSLLLPISWGCHVAAWIKFKNEK